MEEETKKGEINDEEAGEKGESEAGISEDLKVMEDKYKRALADYQNLLKQTAKEKEEFGKYANEQLILAFLPVYDNLKTSLDHIPAEAEKAPWVEGIGHIVRQFKDVLESFSVEEVKTEGERFDHNTMDAVEMRDTDDEEKDGSVAQEYSSGYKLNGKVIKPARVAVYEFKK